MSERTAWIFVLLMVMAGGIGWSHYRRLQGRAEQKKLDEAECAAHPVVKEVPVEKPCPYPEGCVTMSQDTFWKVFDMGASHVAPSKGKRKPPKLTNCLVIPDDLNQPMRRDDCTAAPQPEVKPAPRPPLWDSYGRLVPRLPDDLKLSEYEAENPPLPTFTKEWIGHCPRGFDVYTCEGDGCKNTIPSPDPSDKRKYECYGWNGPIIGVN